MIPFHPLADIFPLIEGREFDALVADVAANGVHDKITFLDGSILDGRNRYRAALAAGLFAADDAIEPGSALFIQYFALFPADADPIGFVISKNLHRRQLNESQRAMAAAKLATLRDGQRADHVEGLPIGRASEMLNVGERSVARARTVQLDGVAELNRKVEIGELRISTAALISRLPKDEQVRLLQEAAPAAVKAAAKEINARAREERRGNVRSLHATLSLASAPLPEDRKYPLIYADPATEFKSGFSDRSIENHYPTESMEFWCALPVGKLALPDCLLMCWTTVPQLGATITKLLPAWGFEYKSCLCWDKTSPDHEREASTGFWARNQHELLLIATRGSPPLPEPADVPNSIYRERKGAHSAKPEHYRELIERMTPSLPRIELFARNRRDGWEAWGNQASPSQSDVATATGATRSSRDNVIGTAGDYAIGEGPNFIPRETPGETASLSEFEQLNLLDAEADKVAVRLDRDLAEPDHAPKIIDGHVQTRLPLSDDEADLQQALVAIDAGENVDSDMVRHVIGLGYAHATLRRIFVTDEGRAFLAGLIDVQPSLDIPEFLKRRPDGSAPFAGAAK